MKTKNTTGIVFGLYAEIKKYDSLIFKAVKQMICNKL